MVISKDEFLSARRTEVRVYLHLASKIDAAQLDFRPAPKQRATLEQVRHLAIMAPIHFRGAMATWWST